MNSETFQKFEAFLCNDQKTKAYPLLAHLEIADYAGLVELIIRYDLAENNGFWKNLLPPQLEFLLSQTEIKDQLLDGYLSRNRKAFFRSDLTATFLIQQPTETLERIRTSSAWQRDDFWATISENNDLQLQEEAMQVLGSYSWYRENILPMREKPKRKWIDILKNGDYTLFELICLMSIYHEQLLWNEMLAPDKFPPLRIQQNVEVVNLVLERGRPFLKPDEISGSKAIEEKYFSILKNSAESPEYWEKFEELMMFALLELTGTLMSDAISSHSGFGQMNPEDFKAINPVTFTPDYPGGNWRKTWVMNQLMPRAAANMALGADWRKGNLQFHAGNYLLEPAYYHFLAVGFPPQFKILKQQYSIHVLLAMYQISGSAFTRTMLGSREILHRQIRQMCDTEEGFLQAFYQHSLESRAGRQLPYLPFGTLPEQKILQLFEKEQAKSERIKDIVQSSLRLMIYSPEYNTAKERWIHITERPFFKIGDYVFWFELSFTSSDIANYAQNLIFRSWENAGDQQSINDRSEYIEKTIGRIFRGHGYSVRQGFKFFPNPPKETEFDLIIWKGKELLLMEVKSTYARYGPKSNFDFQHRIAEAADQLDVRKKVIEEFREQFRLDAGIDAEVNLSEIQTLIVTNTQDGNAQRWGKGKHLKTSLFDLMYLVNGMHVNHLDYLVRGVSELCASERLALNVMGNCHLYLCKEDHNRLLNHFHRSAIRSLERSLPDFVIDRLTQELSLAQILEMTEKETVWSKIDFAREAERFMREEEQEEPFDRPDSREVSTILESAAHFAAERNWVKASAEYLAVFSKGDLQMLSRWIDVLDYLYPPQKEPVK